jgi:hypothetical protein
MKGCVENDLPGGYKIHSDHGFGYVLYTENNEMVGIYDTKEDAQINAYRLFFSKFEVPKILMDRRVNYGY